VPDASTGRACVAGASASSTQPTLAVKTNSKQVDEGLATYCHAELAAAADGTAERAAFAKHDLAVELRGDAEDLGSQRMDAEHVVDLARALDRVP
jgi:hypothetical protein